MSVPAGDVPGGRDAYDCASITRIFDETVSLYFRDLEETARIVTQFLWHGNRGVDSETRLRSKKVGFAVNDSKVGLSLQAPPVGDDTGRFHVGMEVYVGSFDS